MDGDMGTAPGRLRRPPWILVVGVGLVVAVIAGLLVAVVLTLSDGADDDEDDDAALGDLVAASDTLARRVEDERSMATNSIIGIDQTIDMPIADNTAARQATDAAIADHEAAARAAGDVTERQLDAIREAAAGLGPLRQEIDDQPGPANFSAMPQADQVFDRYSEVLDAVLAAGTDLIASQVDSRDDRRGVELIEVGWQQRRALPEMMMGSLMSMGPTSGPDAVADLVAAGAELERGQTVVDELAAGNPYQDAADQLTADLDEAGLPALVDDAQAGGAIDMAALLDVIAASGAAWNDFLDHVEATMLRTDTS